MTAAKAPPIIAEDDDCLWVTHEDMLDHLKEAHGLSLEEFHELEPHHIKGRAEFLSNWREVLDWEHEERHINQPLLKPAHRKRLRICGWRPLSESMHPELESDFDRTFQLLQPARLRPTPTEARELLHNLRQTMRWIEAARAKEILDVLIELLEQLPRITRLNELLCERAEEQVEEVREESQEADLYIVRLFDMFDGWIDVSDPVTKTEAFKLWNEHTKNGTYRTKYEDGDYYAVFPANTRMLVTPESTGR